MGNLEKASGSKRAMQAVPLPDVELANMREDVYGVCLTVLVGSPASYTEWLDDVGYKGDRLSPDVNKAIYQELRPQYMEDGVTAAEFIWLRSKELPTLAHELIHLTTHLFHEKAIPISYDNDETLCYYVEYWLNRISQAWVTTAAKSDPETKLGVQKNAKGKEQQNT